MFVYVFGCTNPPAPRGHRSRSNLLAGLDVVEAPQGEHPPRLLADDLVHYRRVPEGAAGVVGQSGVLGGVEVGNRVELGGDLAVARVVRGDGGEFGEGRVSKVGVEVNGNLESFHCCFLLKKCKMFERVSVSSPFALLVSGEDFWGGRIKNYYSHLLKMRMLDLLQLVHGVAVVGIEGRDGRRAQGEVETFGGQVRRGGGKGLVLVIELLQVAGGRRHEKAAVSRDQGGGGSGVGLEEEVEGTKAGAEIGKAEEGTKVPALGLYMI